MYVLIDDESPSVGRGVGGVHVDAAGAFSFSLGEFDVSLVAPAGSPRVADNHVVLGA